jgi:hypothetical protein
MEKYQVKPYKRGGWVIIEGISGREIILFNRRKQAEEACKFLNEEDEISGELVDFYSI